MIVFRRERIPNYVTGLRIVGAALLLWFDLFSNGFFIVYSLCGISDVIDGWLARRWNAQSEFGSKLDSVSDLAFYSVMLLKVIPYLISKRVHFMVWVVAGSAIFVRICSYVLVAVKYHRFAAIHTFANKLTGLVVFLFPYALFFGQLTVVCFVVGAISNFSSLEELLIHLTSKEYDSGKKSIFLPSIQT